MKKPFLTLMALFLSISFSTMALAHAGHSHDSTMHTILHLVTNVSIFLSIMAVAFLAFKKLPSVIQQRVKK